MDVKLLQVIPTGEEDMRNLFNMIDADNSGKIEFEEVTLELKICPVCIDTLTMHTYLLVLMKIYF